MRALLIVPGQPSRVVGDPRIRRGEWGRLGPFLQERLDEALGLAISFGRIGPRANMRDPELPQHFAGQSRHVT